MLDLPLESIHKLAFQASEATYCAKEASGAKLTLIEFTDYQ